MSVKTILILCVQVLLIQLALSQCLGRAPMAAAASIAGSTMGCPYLAEAGVGYDALSSTYGYSVQELVTLSKNCPYLVSRGLAYEGVATPSIARDYVAMAKYCPYLASHDLRYDGYTAQELDSLSNTCPYLVSLGLTYSGWAAANGYDGQDLTALVQYCPYLVNRGLNYDGSPAAYGYGATLAAPGLVAPALTVPTLAAPAFSAPALTVPTLAAPAFGAPAFAAPGLNVPALNMAAPLGYAAAPAIEFSPTSGGALPVSSASPIPPVGISVSSDNIYDGALSLTGEIPFIGTVAFDGSLPTAGSGVVNHACGNGLNVMSSDSAAYMPAAIAPAAAGFGAPAFGYRNSCAGRFGLAL